MVWSKQMRLWLNNAELCDELEDLSTANSDATLRLAIKRSTETQAVQTMGSNWTYGLAKHEPVVVQKTSRKRRV
jgi:hypothetical protein